VRQGTLGETDELEAGFVDEIGAVELGISEAEGLLEVAGVNGLRGQRELALNQIVLNFAVDVVAQAEGLNLARLEVDARSQLGLDLRAGERLRVDRAGGRGDGVDERLRAHVLLRPGEEPRTAFCERTVNAPLREKLRIGQLLSDIGVFGIERRFFSDQLQVSVQLASARLGGDLDTLGSG